MTRVRRWARDGDADIPRPTRLQRITIPRRWTVVASRVPVSDRPLQQRSTIGPGPNEKCWALEADGDVHSCQIASPPLVSPGGSESATARIRVLRGMFVSAIVPLVFVALNEQAMAQQMLIARGLRRRRTVDGEARSCRAEATSSLSDCTLSGTGDRAVRNTQQIGDPEHAGRTDAADLPGVAAGTEVSRQFP